MIQKKAMDFLKYIVVNCLSTAKTKWDTQKSSTSKIRVNKFVPQTEC